MGIYFLADGAMVDSLPLAERLHSLPIVRHAVHTRPAE